MKTRIVSAILIAVTLCTLGYAVHLRTQIFWLTDRVKGQSVLRGMCEAESDSKSGIYRLYEKESDPKKIDKYSGRNEGPFEIWGTYYRPKVGLDEDLAVEGFIYGYNTMMRKRYKRIELGRIEKKQ